MTDYTTDLVIHSYSSAISTWVKITNKLRLYKHNETWQSDIHCKIKETLLIRDWKPAIYILSRTPEDITKYVYCHFLFHF